MIRAGGVSVRSTAREGRAWASTFQVTWNGIPATSPRSWMRSPNWQGRGVTRPTAGEAGGHGGQKRAIVARSKTAAADPAMITVFTTEGTNTPLFLRSLFPADAKQVMLR